MKILKKYILVPQFYLILCGIIMFFPLNAQDTRFTIVLDAGHGGHDPGAQSAVSKEKDINLAVTLDLGAIIEQNIKDVKVIYTRKTDRYLTLQERADVVNDHHADLFICIHTNSSPSPSAYGAETYTLGLAKTKANLDVAMRENSVILLEEDYRTKYKGFDPNSVDSYIMFEFMQDKYIDRSIEFSSTIEKEFVSYCQRLDRGVRQAGFWVLHRSACPSVLVELGFISNPAEERYLTSDQGQKEMATAIYRAVVDYKRLHDKRSGRQVSANSKPEQPVKTESRKPKTSTPPAFQVAIQKPVGDTIKKQTGIDTSLIQKKHEQAPLMIEKKPEQASVVLPKKAEPSTDIALNKIPVFKVQLLATNKKLKPKAYELKGVEHTEYFVENGLFKYTLGAETEYSKIEKTRKEIISKFPQAFIIAFMGDKKISAKEALKLNK